MIKLNLTAQGIEQEKIKAYLQANASETLTAKIHNGVHIEKDGKQLLSKKDLTTFMAYAEEQVLKLIAENERKGRQVRCIDDATVYGWAIHYFEENSIEGKLFNLDGTPYEPPKPIKKVTPNNVNKYTLPKPQPKPQLNIFDMLSGNDGQAAQSENTSTVTALPNPQPKKGNEIYQRYKALEKKYPDCVIAYRIGDFYEIFGEDAVKISDDLDLTLTGRDMGLDERVPMIGFPYHAIDKYITGIVEHNHKLAIVEDLDNIRCYMAEHANPINIDTGEIIDDEPEELSVAEMRQFDGDINDPNELMTVSKLIGDSPVEDDGKNATYDELLKPTETVAASAQQPEPDSDFDIESERQKLKAIDPVALCIISELLDEKIDIQ